MEGGCGVCDQRRSAEVPAAPGWRAVAGCATSAVRLKFLLHPGGGWLRGVVPVPFG